MFPELTAPELRVLGVLIEKSLALPQAYPMTLNAIVNACNQKSNRDPVTDYSESEVSAAVSSLRRKSLVDQAEPERNSRAVRFRHNVEERFGWNAAQRALMAELILRGPQTLAELRSRASRMTHLDSTEYARELLAEFERTDPPIIVELPREMGRSARRFAQLLGGPVSVPPDTGLATVSPQAEQRANHHAGPADILARLAALEERVDQLSTRLDRHFPEQAPPG